MKQILNINIHFPYIDILYLLCYSEYVQWRNTISYVCSIFQTYPKKIPQTTLSRFGGFLLNGENSMTAYSNPSRDFHMRPFLVISPSGYLYDKIYL